MFKLIRYFAFVSSVLGLNTSNPCRSEKAAYGFICTCDENYCDTLDVPLPRAENSHVLITSSEAGERFSYTKGEFDTDSKCLNRNTNAVNLTIGRRANSRYGMIGFGGAFTGSVTYVLGRFSPQLRHHVYNSYFSSKLGMGYNMMRIPMGGSDFDTEKWVYNLHPENDTNLSNFCELDPRDVERNSQIKEMKQITGNDDFKIVTATWLAAPWLRANHQWGPLVTNQIQPQYYQTWADYHARWLALMKRDGLPIWGLSPANEPYFFQNFGSRPLLSWNGTDQGKWLVEYLKPTLKQTGNEELKILGGDDMRNQTIYWLQEMNKGNPNAIENIDIIAIHPYFDLVNSPNQDLDNIQKLYEQPILYTEMSFGVVDERMKILPGSWPRAERLINLLMNALSHHVVGYIDWNLVLNSTGGPRYNDLFGIDAYILANDNFTGFIKQPLFYAMAHFAKYIVPGSKRIQTEICGHQNRFVQSLAYLRPDDKIAVVLYNNHTANSVYVNVIDDLNGYTRIELKPKSLNTFLYNAKGKRSYLEDNSIFLLSIYCAFFLLMAIVCCLCSFRKSLPKSNPQDLPLLR